MARDLAVPLVLVAVLSSMVFPLPPTALDFLLAMNLAIALILLVSTLYVKDVLAMSSLPAMLLAATLYRLALNVATTRSILGTGDGGELVEAFGTVVIGGNLPVGLIVFLVITLIQFLVIAKGAERVAEVAARFTLDAMPGKQMSIDADVRAGLIDFETARKRRNETQIESRFYGALDGAMKFVKGDAIAGLCITAINLLGGFAVGMLIEGLDFSRALHKYALLSIGDGLVSQIPALMNALAAGLVVTRVSRGDDATLAQELLTQIWSVRHARLLTGIFAIIVGSVSGMPSIPFLGLGVVLLASLLWPGRSSRAAVPQPATPAFAPRTPSVLTIEVDSSRVSALQNRPDLADRLYQLRQEIYEQRGLILPLPELSRKELPGACYHICVRGVPQKRGNSEIKDNDLLDDMLSALKDVIERSREELIDDILTRRTLDFFEKEAPELVAAVVPNIVSVTQLTEILRCLVRDGISIRHFDMIMQAVAEHGHKTKDERVLLEEVRAALRRVISFRYAGTGGILKAVILDPVIDLAFARAERERLAIDLHVLSHVADRIKARSPHAAVLVTSKSARRLVSECLALRGAVLPVIAHEEIVSEVRLEIVDCVQLPEAGGAAREFERLAA